MIHTTIMLWSLSRIADENASGVHSPLVVFKTIALL
nr:MAG TPA: hypothetical protein [Caudoviricetes sp.]